MIEKIMKAVKSGNKKRGRNITIGAVVGMLLSCTVAMGEDEYLWIKGEKGKIEFSTVDNASVEEWKEENPYVDNSWEGNTYTNNMALSGTGNAASDVNGYGLRLSGDLSSLNFINNGSISGTSTNSEYGYGSGIHIYISGTGKSTTIGNIKNNGVVSGVDNDTSKSSYGINITCSEGSNLTTENITNNGIIHGGSNGIYTASVMYDDNNTNSIKSIINSGIISGGNSRNTGIDKAGIYILGTQASNTVGSITNSGIISSEGGSGIHSISQSSGSSTVGNITNSGIIYGGNDNGIYNKNNSGKASTMGSIANSGVIYGKTNTIKNEGTGTTTTIGQSYNYGILVAGSSNVVSTNLSIDSTTGSGHIKNLGLTIKSIDTTAIVTAASDSTDVDVIVGYNDAGEALIRKMNIKNKNDSSSFNGTEGDNSILNALENTYKVDGDYTVTDSIINAYKTAVVFDTSGGSLTLSGTIVNGGLDGTSYVIAGGTGNDTLTLTNGTLINGTIDGGGTADSDTLNFGEAVAVNAIAASNSDDEIRVLHNISNFENINVNSNVTFYETGVAVTGADEITINTGGVLTLRIDPSKTGTDDVIEGHALYGNDGTINSTGGKLLLALNGAVNESIISFGDTVLGSGLTKNTLGTTSTLHIVNKLNDNHVQIMVKPDLPDYLEYPQLNKIYQGIVSVDDLINNFNVDDEGLVLFLDYLNNIYAGSPYSYSSELSRKSAGMFRDIVTENIFRPETNKWMIYGGLTHVDGGNKDTYYGKGYYTYDIGSSDMDADTKITGAYMLGEYGVSDTLTSGVIIGGNKLKFDLSNSSKVDGSTLYLGAYAKKYVGNLKVTAGAGFQYGDYDADRMAVNRVASDETKAVMKYSDNYNDITYDIYLNGRYSHQVGDNLFLEPYATLSYTYIDQDGTNEGSKVLAIETDSKSFDYTVGKVGVDLKKVIPHEKGKSTLSAGVSYTKILDGADEEYITGRFKGSTTDFDILVAHKNEHSIGLNAKYALELESGVIFDVKGTYSVERDSHNGSAKNKTKGEWIVGAGIGYKF